MADERASRRADSPARPIGEGGIVPRRCAHFLGVGEAALLVFLVLGDWGCSPRAKARFKPAILATGQDVNRYIELAENHSDADIRRSAVVQIGKTRYGGGGTVLEALARIATTDRNSSVCGAALRVLEKHPGPTCVDTMIQLLDPADPDAVPTPVGDAVRWQAMAVLGRYSARLLFRGEVEAAVRRAGIAHLLHDPSRDVRICAAKMLRHHPNVEAARALIEAMGQPDFGVVYEALASLRYLTGQSMGDVPSDWRTWLETAEEPFAEGRAMQARQPQPPRPWWRFERG